MTKSFDPENCKNCPCKLTLFDGAVFAIFWVKWFCQVRSYKKRTLSFEKSMSETNLYSRALLYFKGHCCISYEVCPDEDNAFSLSSKANSLVDNFCNEDYIIIESSMNSCKGNIITHRYCGRVLNSVGGQTINHNICGNSLHTYSHTYNNNCNTK